MIVFIGLRFLTFQFFYFFWYLFVKFKKNSYLRPFKKKKNLKSFIATPKKKKKRFGGQPFFCVLLLGRKWLEDNSILVESDWLLECFLVRLILVLFLDFFGFKKRTTPKEKFFDFDFLIWFWFSIAIKVLHQRGYLLFYFTIKSGKIEG